MNARQMLLGVGILANYGAVTFSAEHDQIWAHVEGVDFQYNAREENEDGETKLLDPSPLSDEDLQTLEDQGWFFDPEVDSFSHYT